MKIQFLGAAQTVTGSKYLVSANGSRILVDCGLYQGVKNLRLRNRSPLPLPVGEIDAVVLSHAHIDHSGFLPAIYRQGYRGPIYCSHATLALCKVLLPDAMAGCSPRPLARGRPIISSAAFIVLMLASFL